MAKNKINLLIILILISSINIIYVQSLQDNLISEKKLYSEKYQKIETPYIDFELPKEATHYWNPEGLDKYEIIIHNLTFKGYTSKIIKLTWYDDRYNSDTIRINYTVIKGILTKDNINPYSIKSKSNLNFNNLTIQLGEILGYDIIEEINNSCDIAIDKCLIKVSYPIYRWSSYSNIDLTKINPTTSSLSYTAIDDVNVSSCGTLSANNTYYKLNKSISSTGTCITIVGNNITIDGNGYTITWGTTASMDRYGITSSASPTYKNGLTIINTKFNQSSTASTNYAIYINNINNTLVRNNTINAGYSAITIGNGVNHTVTNNNITQKSTGYIWTMLSVVSLSNPILNNISYNSIYITVNTTNGIVGQYCEIYNNNITMNSSNGAIFGVIFSSSLSRSYIHNNILTSTGINNYAYYSYGGGSNIFENNLFNMSRGTGFYFSGFRNSCGGNDTLINNTIINNKSFYDFDLAGCSNYVYILKDQIIQNYSFGSATGNKITYETSAYGKVKSIQNWNGVGANLSKDIIIGNNSIWINASNPSINKSANVSIYNLPEYNSGTGYINNSIIGVCDTTTNPNCSAITSLDTGIVRTFAVSSWYGSPYSILGSSGILISIINKCKDYSKTIYYDNSIYGIMVCSNNYSNPYLDYNTYTKLKIDIINLYGMKT